MNESQIWQIINKNTEKPKHLVCYCGYLLRDHPNKKQVIECHKRRTNPNNVLNRVVEVITEINPAKLKTKISLNSMLKSWEKTNIRIKMFYTLRGF